jgi:hypothetical protein
VQESIREDHPIKTLIKEFTTQMYKTYHPKIQGLLKDIKSEYEEGIIQRRLIDDFDN